MLDEAAHEEEDDEQANAEYPASVDELELDGVQGLIFHVLYFFVELGFLILISHCISPL